MSIAIHRAWLAIGLCVILLSGGFAQVTEIGGVGNIFKKRTSATPETRANKPTPAPKPSPTPAAQQGQRQQGQAQPTPPPGAPRSQTVVNRGPQQAQQQKGRAANAPSQAPANTGQLQVVTKGLADSVKTRLVRYDEEALRTSGTAIILSDRRYKPTE